MRCWQLGVVDISKQSKQFIEGTEYHRRMRAGSQRRYRGGVLGGCCVSCALPTYTGLRRQGARAPGSLLPWDQGTRQLRRAGRQKARRGKVAALSMSPPGT